MVKPMEIVYDRCCCYFLGKKHRNNKRKQNYLQYYWTQLLNYEKYYIIPILGNCTPNINNLMAPLLTFILILNYC